MNKELEYLADLHSHTYYDTTDVDAKKVISKAFNALKKALTPSTADEVCKAIQDELPYGNVEYIEGNKEFMFVNHGEKSNITSVYGDSYKITGFYKSSTIMLIGRFYEGLGK